MPVDASALDDVMVRRLKSDLVKLNADKFPRRDIEPIVLDGLPPDTPELVLADLLQRYRDWAETGLDQTALARTAFVFSGLQQRLLSSIPAFLRTLRKHLETLKRHRDAAEKSAALSATAAALFAAGAAEIETGEADDDESALETLSKQEEEIADAASAAVIPLLKNLDMAISLVEEMIEIARTNERKADARVAWLGQWIRANLLTPAGEWNERRLLIFTEWEDTRLWLEKRLKETITGTDRSEDRIAAFTGITGQERRERVKAAFNADPSREPLRILICTDAAREGINLQTRCHDLIHLDLPWNPSRLEQRNGRIDRKLQPSPVVTCRYFDYAQRPEDRVLATLVRKTETIREQLGSAGQVIAERIHQRLARSGIQRQRADALAHDIEAENGDAASRLAKQEMADEEEKRLARLKRDLVTLDRELDRAKRLVGIKPADLKDVLETALARDGIPLAPARDADVDNAFALDPSLPAFARDASWADLFDELRQGRPPTKRKKLTEWRDEHPVRAISFTPPILADGRDAERVVQVHLEHRLVRRLLARFISYGFEAGLNRASVVFGPGSHQRVVLVGRLALYGPGGARLHEEMIPVTAPWMEGKPLKAFGRAGEETTLRELEEALRENQTPSEDIVRSLMTGAPKDVSGLKPALEERAEAARQAAIEKLAEIAAKESVSLTLVLSRTRDQIVASANDRAAVQLELDLADPAERRQREADRKYWQKKLASIEEQLKLEPDRIRESYTVIADRLEPIALVYLWPRGR